MKRRTFLNWMGVGCASSSLPVAIAACDRQTATPPAPQTSPTAATSPAARADGFQSVGTVAELDRQGYLLKKDGAAPIFVARAADNPQALTAVNPTCTHKGCTVDWKATEKTFNCPCHGAKYGPDGAVLGGPTQKSLATYVAKIEADTVFVKVV